MPLAAALRGWLVESLPACAVEAYVCSHAVQVCGGFHLVRFCSAECQKAAWGAHKPVCKAGGVAALTTRGAASADTMAGPGPEPEAGPGARAGPAAGVEAGPRPEAGAGPSTSTNGVEGDSKKNKKKKRAKA